MSVIYDNTAFIGKPGAAVVAGSGRIPGAVKLEMWRPGDTWPHDGSGDILLHVEPGVQANFGTKPERKAAKVTIDGLSDMVAAQYPQAKQWWYCPPLLRDDWYQASLGNKASQQRIKDWKSATYDLPLEGIPGPRIHGVCVDLYDFYYMRSVWKARAAENFKPWLDHRRPILPILYLRWKDTGVLYTDAEARERIEFCVAVCGRVAIHDGYGINGLVYEQYGSWPLRELVESIARGN